MSEKIKCAPYFGCNRIECPAHGSDDPNCWLIDGACRRSGDQDGDLTTAERCLACPVLKNNMDQETMTASCAMMTRQFRDARQALNARDRELEAVSMEMALGLSEVFEALQKIATGDPLVRLDETSSLELIAKLKQMVNRTAAQMGEMVDMAHEFAMGLAEHFDVLHRVKAGDLDARVEGGSTIELLDALKTVTNRMIRSVKSEIDHRQKVARELEVSENRFRTFVEKAPIGITIMDPDLRFEFINRTFTEMFGYTIADLPDKPSWFDTVFPDRDTRQNAIAAWEAAYQRGVECDQGGIETSDIQCKNGILKTIIIRTVIMENGKHLVTYTDITREAMAQAVLRESEKKYRTLIDNIQDGVILIDNWRFVFVNEAMARIVGYTVSELIGSDVRNILAPEDSALVIERYERRRSGEAVPQSYEFRMLHKDGITRPYVNIHIGVINYQDRVVSIGTIKDITKLKQAERERREMAEKLQRSQNMEAIGTLAGGVAHDLNNILSGIVSYPELLLLDLPRESPLRDPILTIQKSGERAAAIVQDLLTLARRGVATKNVVNLNQIIVDYLASPEFVKLSNYHSNVRVHHRLAGDLLPISGSSVHLSKTVMNLISNAAEAMPDGGDILITTANRYVEKRFKGHGAVITGEHVVLSVQDTGVGISPADLARIFEPFYTKKIMGRSGTGLGMAVVWGTVKDHDGHIDVSSTEGEGTTLTILFPVSRERLPITAAPVTMDTLSGSGERILVVDDVPEQREIASAMLSRLNYAVAAVDSGEAAVAYLRTQPVDLMILDMIMAPGIDGLETYRQVTAIHPGQKAVVASGFSESERMRELRGLGVGEYLKKPYTLEKLGMAVKRALAD